MSVLWKIERWHQGNVLNRKSGHIALYLGHVHGVLIRQSIRTAPHHEATQQTSLRAIFPVVRAGCRLLERAKSFQLSSCSHCNWLRQYRYQRSNVGITLEHGTAGWTSSSALIVACAVQGKMYNNTAKLYIYLDEADAGMAKYKVRPSGLGFSNLATFISPAIIRQTSCPAWTLSQPRRAGVHQVSTRKRIEKMLDNPHFKFQENYHSLL